MRSFSDFRSNRLSCLQARQTICPAIFCGGDFEVSNGGNGGIICSTQVQRRIMTDAEIKAAIKAIVNHCGKLTIQLVRLSSEREVIGIASGFFIVVEGATYLISAGHALEKNGWAIETSFIDEAKCRTACIPINGPWTLKKLTSASPGLQEVDVAWAKIDFTGFQKSVSEQKGLKGKSFEYMMYQGPLEEIPNATDPHAYAAANKVLLVPIPAGMGLDREYTYEVEMEYKGVRGDGLYVFSIPKHKGHEYYRGASGAPIVEPSGKVVAILIKGCEAKNELYGYPTRGLVGLIKIGDDVEKQGSTNAGPP
jgi:hypothetical protein